MLLFQLGTYIICENYYLSMSLTILCHIRAEAQVGRRMIYQTPACKVHKPRLTERWFVGDPLRRRH